MKTLQKNTRDSIRVALLCGGPSLERGISLNSARSVLDHLGGESVEIVPIYFDQAKHAYHISTSQLYSNTPSDFDFKLKQNSKPLSSAGLVRLLKTVDIAFPVMHGAFGEDGAIQSFLEKHRIPYIGSPSTACKQVFDKYKANTLIAEHGFYTLPSTVLKIYAKDHKKIVTDFFKEHSIKRAIVKPATGGSSIGVFSVSTTEEALAKVEYIFSKRMDTRVVIEPFANGIEFTVILLENHLGQGVAVLPTEIESDYTDHQIFDFRKKYLPTRAVTYHCPPRFSNEIIEKIQIQAEQLFKLFGMRDFARFDGWVFPDGSIWFSDFNPISGMEQNSFLFQQSVRIGFSHHDVLLYILKNALRRYNMHILDTSVESLKLKDKNVKKKGSTDSASKKPVSVIFGGSTAERQVSLMSGTNVWLKLRKSNLYIPRPYVLGFNNDVWEMPYALILNHTVEEIIENAQMASSDMARLKFLIEKVVYKLALTEGDKTEEFFIPRRYSLKEFIKSHKGGFIFLGLHGGMGEGGSMQAMLDKAGVTYNGPSAKVSALCMNKFATAQAVNKLAIPYVHSAHQKTVALSSIRDIPKLWSSLLLDLDAKTVIVKPLDDGCSAGIARLFSAEDLEKYIGFVRTQSAHIPAGTFQNQKTSIDMPTEQVAELLFENFIETDVIKIKGAKLAHTRKTDWIEVTVGVYTSPQPSPYKGEGVGLHVLSPSLTVAEGEVLSVEEKFQGGTGVNITPPPESIVKTKILNLVKERIGMVARGLGITGYSRIDAFIHTKTGEVSIIEVNTLPALTPSTVIYHQALVEPTPIFPTEFLEMLIKNKGY
jgi:D-alanine--D-alanine ligase